MAGPISPTEANELRQKNIPDEVYDAFNTLIVRNLINGQAIVKVNEVVSLIQELIPFTTDLQIFDNHWLDVENAYRAKNWIVLFEKPGFGDSWDSHFIFKMQSIASHQR